MESIRLSSYWHRAPIRTRKYMALFVDFFCAAVRIDKRVVFHQSQTTLANSKAGVFVHYVFSNISWISYFMPARNLCFVPMPSNGVVGFVNS